MRSITVAPDVILHLEEGEAFLLHVASGRYFGLNRSGVIVWNALVNGADPVEGLVQQWPNRSSDELRSDAAVLVDQLLKAGLISEGVDEPDS